MTYYHITISYTSKEKNIVFKYDKDIDSIKKRFVKEYNKNIAKFTYEGEVIQAGLIDSIKIYQSNTEFKILQKEYESIQRAKYPNICMFTQDHECLEYEKFTDITQKVFDEVEEEDKKVDREELKTRPKMVFISHNSQDKEFAIALTNLLEVIGLNNNNLFCSSAPGYGVDAGKNIFETLKQKFINYDLYVIFIQSPRFYKSAVSLNEMGAAWVLQKECFSFLTSDMSFDKMHGVFGSQYLSIKITNDDAKYSLNNFKKSIISFLELNDNIDATNWEIKRDQFLEKTKNIQYKKGKK